MLGRGVVVRSGRGRKPTPSATLLRTQDGGVGAVGGVGLSGDVVVVVVSAAAGLSCSVFSSDPSRGSCGQTQGKER